LRNKPVTPIALFVSDLHLQAAHPNTSAAFFAFLRDHASHARQLYLLGDVFEYWAGDDDLADPEHAGIVMALRQLSDAGVAIFWLGGNRDFLVGEAFAKATGITLLTEPFVADIGGQRIVLVHGDAECTDDLPYMQFRAMVRQPAWQAQFLAQPLAQRKAIIAGMRSGSREQQRSKSMDIMDVNPAAIRAVFARTGTHLMIHGHTHRPARHVHEEEGREFVRYVLPDWDCDGSHDDGHANAPRGGWIAVGQDGIIRRHQLDGAGID
jgi:UDP-2,3-diacylglucosamine hydrolase